MLTIHRYIYITLSRWRFSSRRVKHWNTTRNRNETKPQQVCNNTTELTGNVLWHHDQVPPSWHWWWAMMQHCTLKTNSQTAHLSVTLSNTHTPSCELTIFADDKTQLTFSVVSKTDYSHCVHTIFCFAIYAIQLTTLSTSTSANGTIQIWFYYHRY